ncbi:ATP-binding protein [Desulforamulus aquiferis]|uniref:ATP-binding protein n=1 Tax=Desulforamulus aquiferis TaxID=1397668 RepID=A0AAW7Z8H8_9FIRM|nr:ATP-binding protein [Desulforamulus aquiferis]MDO7785696.1 ATP-binding protein [Desulforamulus aquiferis]
MTKAIQPKEISQALAGLTLFRGIKSDPVLECYTGIIKAYLADEDLLDEYHRLVMLLLDKATSSNLPQVGDLWQDYILDLLLLDNNLFCREAAIPKDISQPIREACIHDLSRLQIICQQGLEVINSIFETLPHFKLAGLRSNETNLDEGILQQYSPIKSLKLTLLNSNNWTGNIGELVSFYRCNGFAQFALYRAFRWEEISSSFELVGIEKPDPITLEQLFSYERQRGQVLDNTERLLRGLPAQNLILYGDRGTGKSSTVKALVNRYGGQGLRLVQMSRDSIHGLQRAMTYLGKIPLKFIIFIDDLSFEENETHYKILKTQMEGSIEQQPANIRIYVTSNQRNLIKEYFTDRKNTLNSNGDVHPGDTMQEKLSLADRFGLKITFIAPDQANFLAIVREMADLEKLQVDQETLEKLALKWTLWHNERSGRTARQFIDHLKGRKNLNFI